MKNLSHFGHLRLAGMVMGRELLWSGSVFNG